MTNTIRIFTPILASSLLCLQLIRRQCTLEVFRDANSTLSLVGQRFIKRSYWRTGGEHTRVKRYLASKGLFDHVRAQAVSSNRL